MLWLQIYHKWKRFVYLAKVQSRQNWTLWLGFSLIFHIMTSRHYHSLLYTRVLNLQRKDYNYLYVPVSRGMFYKWNHQHLRFMLTLKRLVLLYQLMIFANWRWKYSLTASTINNKMKLCLWTQGDKISSRQSENSLIIGRSSFYFS